MNGVYIQCRCCTYVMQTHNLTCQHLKSSKAKIFLLIQQQDTGPAQQHDAFTVRVGVGVAARKRMVESSSANSKPQLTTTRM